MKEIEYKLIIDRERQEKDAKQYFSKHLNLLVDIVNYGSNLIPRTFDSSSKKLEDIIVVGVLLKQIVSMVDAVEILVSKGAVDAAHLPARAAFEASLYIDWILLEESEKKAKYYYISNLRNERLWAQRYKTGTPEEQKFSESFEDIRKYIEIKDRENMDKQLGAKISEIEQFLSIPGWSEINDEFEGKYKRRKAESEWYKVLGVTSIRRLAKEVERLAEYDLFYARSSEVMHGTSYKDHVQFAENTVSFEPVRYLKDANSVLRFITLTAIHSYQAILKCYRCGELTSFKRKYTQDWRQEFLNIPSITYTKKNLRF